MPTYRCKHCGSARLIVAAWIDMNTREELFDSGDPPTDTIWCRECDREIHWRDVIDPYDDEPRMGSTRARLDMIELTFVFDVRHSTWTRGWAAPGASMRTRDAARRVALGLAV
jgi:hypothetical protein